MNAPSRIRAPRGPRAAARARASSAHPPDATRSATDGRLPWTLLLLALGALARGLYLSQLSRTAFGGYIFGDSAYYIGQSKLAWHTLLGSPAFLSPLYPGVLKALASLDISMPQGVRVVQMAAGLLTALAIGRLGARLVSPRVGHVALALAALYPPFIFFEAEILPASLSLLFQVMAMLWVVEAREQWRTAPRTARVRALAAGVAGGVAALLAPALILVAVVLAFWWAWADRAAPRRDLRGPALALAGVLLALAPTTIGTALQARTPVPLSTSSGVNLWIGNGPGATGTFHLTPADSLGADTRGLESTMVARAEASSPAAASRVWTERAVRYIAQHPVHAARLWGTKLLLLANHVEGPSQTDFGYLRSLCWALWIPLPFVALLALGVAGLLWIRRHAAGATSLLVAVLLAAALSPVVVFVTARHRLPLLPLLILGTAACVIGLLDAARGRADRRRARATLLLAAALLAIGLLPLGSARADRPRMLALEALGELGRGRPADAVARFEEARALTPDDPTLLANLGAAYQRNGELDRALPLLRRAAADAPRNPAIAMNLGRVYLRAGHPDSAAVEFGRAADLGGGADALRVLAATERQQQHWYAAIAALRRVHVLEPGDQASRSDLGAVLLQAGRTQEAVAELEAVTRQGVLFPDPWMNLAAAYRGLGRRDDAIHAMSRAGILAPGDRGVMLSLATARRAEGDVQGALAVLRTYLQRVGRDSLAQALVRRYTAGAP